MRVVDLGHPITNDMTTYPGDIPAVLKPGSRIETGSRSTLISIDSHSGTHVDAPAHILEDGKYMEELAKETFFGIALVIDVTKCAGRKIDLADINAIEIKNIDYADFVLFRTDWSNKWNTKEYLSGFPVLSEPLAEFLTKQNLKGVGFDTISADEIDSTEMTIHKILLRSEILIIENLCNLNKVEEKPFCMVCLPISLTKQDGGPARVMAILKS